LEAFAKLKTQNSKLKTTSQISNLTLTMPGGQFVDDKKIETKMIKATVKKFGLESSVDFPGFVEQKELIKLYRRALVFVYPSYYEGFGLPVLEAMACGTPVVTSNVSSLPEVAGDSAILVDPYDVGSIAEGIKEALNSHALEDGKYEEMVRKGLEQSKKFSWQTCTRETLTILRSTGVFRRKYTTM